MRFRSNCHLLKISLVLLTMNGISNVDAQTQLSQPAGVEWSLDQTTGTSVPDTLGKFIGKVVGNAAWGGGLPGTSALMLDGSGCVEVANPPIDTNRSFTVTAWVKAAQMGGYQTFVSIDGKNVSGFFLQLRDDTGTFAFTKPEADSTSVVDLASADDVPQVGKWYHLAGVYNAANHTISLYVNGVLQQSVHCESFWSAPGPLTIGRAFYGGRPVDYVHGSIEDVELFQQALTSQQIKAVAGPDLSTAGKLGPVIDNVPIPLNIDASKTVIHVSPTLYGLMTEEINHSYDGGLYGELIQNRIFKDNKTKPVHWSLVQDGGREGSISLDFTHPMDKALTTCLKLTVSAGQSGGDAGFANDGFWGIAVKPDTVYRATFYAKADAGFTGSFDLSLQSADGTHIYAKGTVPQISTQWTKYSVLLKTGDLLPSLNNRFVITTSGSGTVWFNLVSLFAPTYDNTVNGNKPYLMRELAMMKPAFLRFPGGNYLEGNSIKDRFNWKKTIGPLRDRPGHEGPWGYRSSDGMGLLEFLEWCQDLNMQPLLAVYAGYSLDGEYVKPGKALEPYVQSALDEIEYTIGPVTSKWGAIRAKDGHPAPFHLNYVEIGNEDFFDKSGSYNGRFAQFYKAIKAKYPQLKIIATMKVSSVVPDVIDEHYYLSPYAFEHIVNKYDTYSRSGPKIFVGEWASQEGQPTPDMNAALGDSAWMTGMENNSDIVVLSSYAPLFVLEHPGASQWGTNLIGYNGLEVYGSPSYYAQVMFSNNIGNIVPSFTLGSSPDLFASVTRDSHTGTLYIKLVNSSIVPRTISVTLTGVGKINSTGTAIVLSAAHRYSTNTLQDPIHIAPVTSILEGVSKKFTLHLAPLSVNVYIIRRK